MQIEVTRSEVETDPEPVQALLQQVSAALQAGVPEHARELMARIPRHQRPAPGGRPLTAKEQWRVFRRDRFLCRYCGKRTLFVPVLRVLSALFPEELPYHPHWKWEVTHPVYWTYSASIDHVVPVCRGGGSGIANLVTACYMCNSIKQNWLLEELRWELLQEPPPAESWDGLSGSYLQLHRLAALPWDRYHEAWIKVLRNANLAPSGQDSA